MNNFHPTLEGYRRVLSRGTPLLNQGHYYQGLQTVIGMLDTTRFTWGRLARIQVYFLVDSVFLMDLFFSGNCLSLCVLSYKCIKLSLPRVLSRLLEGGRRLQLPILRKLFLIIGLVRFEPFISLHINYIDELIFSRSIF